MSDKTLNIGIVGAGGFARFAAQAFIKAEGITIGGITDVHASSAAEMAASFGAAVYSDMDMLLADKAIDLIYIATPPYLHYSQSRIALLAGKHVICEKPAALKVNEAEELVDLATAHHLLYTVNLMQRYNPLFSIVKTIVDEKLIGGFLHGFFENYASDENLTPEHWFWDEGKSGGIFIEHGVHFFDLFAGWLGEGKVISAVQLQRPDINEIIYDRVQATVLYKDGFVNFYHGFDQPKMLDRQEMRLQFEHGEITLYEWIPVRMKLHGIFTAKQLEGLKKLLVNFSIKPEQNDQLGTHGKAHGRFKEINFSDHVTIEYGNNSDKQNRYGEMLTAMITDQWNWIKDRSHIRCIDGSNAVHSLRVAAEATRMAQQF